jgi:hypothetical protein
MVRLALMTCVPGTRQIPGAVTSGMLVITQIRFTQFLTQSR